ncbi:MAG: STM4015 family protein [Xanthomonadales bacterium]|nr:STM4015 family protein [Xanthomonadales bacterium]MCB1641913.1 STM4015 family protein [Xanthomonadales bacterium]
MIERKLIYMDAKSSKFWNIRQEGDSHTVTYGRTGSAGQTSAKSFASEALAVKDAEKLIREKLGKGYVEASDSPQDGSLPLAAFASINHRDDVYRNAGTFVGLRVVDYDMEKPARSDVAYRFRSDWDEDQIVPALKHFLSKDEALQATAIVIGAWFGDDSEKTPGEVLDVLIENRDRLPLLSAVFVGDITSEENEMSWINQTDLAPLLNAFPDLQLLRARGGTSLVFTPLQHAKLRGLALETGGMDASVLRGVCSSQFNELEHLELWLGTEDYGATVRIEDLQPLLSGEIFPNLKYLGLRNSDMADQIAAVVVNSPLMQRIETLDLSLGTLSDEGGEALLHLKDSKLKKLNLHYHFMSPELVRRLRALPFVVDVTTPSDMDTDEDFRFVAVGE